VKRINLALQGCPFPKIISGHIDDVARPERGNFSLRRVRLRLRLISVESPSVSAPGLSCRLARHTGRRFAVWLPVRPVKTTTVFDDL
jgi:hypothetical protein